MIGNDIVDLHHAAKTSNWKRPRFLEKVFTQEEKLIIANSSNQHKTVWLLWSMKEAAYKIHVRQFGNRFFNPKRLVCSLNSTNKGIVRVDNESYHTESTITQDYIYTTVTSLEIEITTSRCFKMISQSNNFQSKICRYKSLKAYSEMKNEDINILSIKKNALNIPLFYKNNIKQPESLSITHHGQYYAYAIL